MKAEISVRELNGVTQEEFLAILSGPADEAARWLHAAAEQGVTEAQAHYAQLLLDGKGVEQNMREAFLWFRIAASQEHAMAMNMMGRCYENGWGVQESMLLATYWFRLAAQAGLDWGMYNYATSLALGRGVEADREEAFLWLGKAAALDHAKSWNLLGGFHEDGWTGAVDMAAALDCYRKAAAGGDFRGEFNYGRLLASRGELTMALDRFVRAYRNPSATAAFRDKLRRYLEESPVDALRDLRAALD